MRVLIITPAPRGSRSGNRLTALRWAAHLRALGHRVVVRDAADADATEPADLAVALHAEKSAAFVRARAGRDADPGLVLVMTGTDLYDHAELSAVSVESCARAARIVVLQPGAVERVPAAFRDRVRCIPQSAVAPRGAGARGADDDRFLALSLAHVRPVKDPLLLARAARRAPEGSRLAVVLAGASADADLERAVRAESDANPRFTWIGPLTHGAALRRLATADVLVVSSRNEGGPAVVPEAIACGVPVLSTDMPAARALLGVDHPGLYPVGDDAALAALLSRVETDADFRARLVARSLALQPEVRPDLERRRIADLLAELRVGRAGGR